MLVNQKKSDSDWSEPPTVQVHSLLCESVIPPLLPLCV